MIYFDLRNKPKNFFRLFRQFNKKSWCAGECFLVILHIHKINYSCLQKKIKKDVETINFTQFETQVLLIGSCVQY